MCYKYNQVCVSLEQGKRLTIQLFICPKELFFHQISPQSRMLDNIEEMLSNCLSKMQSCVQTKEITDYRGKAGFLILWTRNHYEIVSSMFSRQSGRQEIILVALRLISCTEQKLKFEVKPNKYLLNIYNSLFLKCVDYYILIMDECESNTYKTET